ncbi:unnamed protein product [Ambrosiozyma monospora]|uniref:Unnamed protein product n=1 Tax=Ambrosiozyma monospora TaxID=43982 RepID=A0ACB5T669_AMBMO|nr:unnamed protein product [Ambrosiozyma monospora]
MMNRESNIPHLTNGQSPDTNDNDGTGLRKRSRNSFVCSNCKKKKIKCDRQSPCSNCVKSKIQSSCIYQNPIKKPHIPSQQSPHSSTSFLLNRFPPYQSPTLPIQGQVTQRLSNQRGTPISNPSPSSEDQQLKHELQEIKSQIRSLEELLKKKNESSSAPASKLQRESSEPQPTSIMNFKIKEKTNVVIRKASRTGYYGPLSLVAHACNNSSPSRASIFIKFLQKERNAFKQLHKKQQITNLNPLGTQTSPNDALNEEIEQFFLPQFDAIMERFGFFDDQLNKFLYAGMFDMDVIGETILNMFPDTKTGRSFARPKKCYIYSYVACVVAIIQTVHLFSYYDTGYRFMFPINVRDLQYLNDFAIRLLNISRFQEKLNVFSLMALILLKDNIYKYGNTSTGDEAKSYSRLQIQVTMAMQLGLHRDPSSIERYVSKCGFTTNTSNNPLSTNCARQIWWYLRIQDGLASAGLGIPLLINDDYCDMSISFCENSEFSELCNQFADLIRETAYTMNSLKATSLNEYKTLMNKLLDTCYRVGTFQELFVPKPGITMTLIAKRVLMKLQLLRTILMFGCFLKSTLGKLNLFPLKSLTAENVYLLKRHAIFYESFCLKTCYIIMCTIKNICDPQGIFKDHHSSYLLFFKYEISILLCPIIFTLAFHGLEVLFFLFILKTRQQALALTLDLWLLILPTNATMSRLLG